jgi:hypothetical protein
MGANIPDPGVSIIQSELDRRSEADGRYSGKTELHAD